MKKCALLVQALLIFHLHNGQHALSHRLNLAAIARVPSLPKKSVQSISSSPLSSSPAKTTHNQTASRTSPIATTSILRNEWIGDGHLHFTFNLLNGIFMNSLDMKKGNFESIAFSPFSIQSILMMLHLGAKGSTKSEIAKVLYLESSENNATFSKSHEAFGKAVRSLLEDPNVIKSLHSSNQIFVQEDLHLSKTYMLALQHYHMSTIKYVDFAKDSYKVLSVINDWIEKQTQHLIVNFLNNPPSPMTTLMAVNAIRFKGDWQYRFDPTDTEKNSWFRTINGHTSKVEMMVAQLPVAYAYNSELQTSIIELPYKMMRLSLFVLLPDDTFGLFTLLGSLNATVFANLIYSMRKVNNGNNINNHNNNNNAAHYGADKLGSSAGVNIRIPKFVISSMPRITNILRNQLGLKSLFSSEQANLEAMFSQSLTPVHMDELLHKAVLRVDEQGSVGAAVSTSSNERVGTFTGPYFEADHPFVFLLIDKQTGLALFAGFYLGPSGSPNERDSSKNIPHLFGGGPLGQGGSKSSQTASGNLNLVKKTGKIDSSLDLL